MNWHHGWANSGNREEPTLGLVQLDEARLTTHHRLRKRSSVVWKEKEGDRGLRPCEDQEPAIINGLVARTS
jgi:hypothetical protein